MSKSNFSVCPLFPFSSLLLSVSLISSVSLSSACWLLSPPLRHAFYCMTVLFSTRTANGFVNMSCMVIYSHHSSPKKQWWLMAHSFWTKKKLMTAVTNLPRKAVLLTKTLVKTEWFSQAAAILAAFLLLSIHCWTEKIRRGGDET